LDDRIERRAIEAASVIEARFAMFYC